MTRTGHLRLHRRHMLPPALLAAALLASGCNSPAGGEAAARAEEEQWETAPAVLQHVPEAFGEAPAMPAEACMRDLWGDEQQVRETAAGQGAQGRESPTVLAALMRDTSRAAPLLAGQQLLCSRPPRSLAVADLDHDGDLDLLAASTGEDNWYWVNDGTGLFARHPYDPLQLGRTPDLPEALQDGLSDYVESDSYVCDLDGDGWGEIITVHATSEKSLPVTIQQTGADWPNTPVQRIETPANIGSAAGLTCADINRDGVLDIIHTIRSGPLEHEERAAPIRMLISDITEEGVTWQEEGSLRLPDQRRYSRSRAEVAGSSRWGILPFEPRLLDLDGDGDLDLMVTADFGAPLLYENIEGFFRRQKTPLLQHYNTMGISAIDMNDDRRLDLLITDIDLRDISTCPWSVTCPQEQQSPSGHAILLQQGDMRLTQDDDSPTANAFRYNGWGWGFTSVDINGDGWWDLIQAGGQLGVASENSISWPYRAQPPVVLEGGPEGPENRTRQWAETWNLTNGSLTIVSADMTGDGSPDIVIYGEAVGRPQLYQNLTPAEQYGHLKVISPAQVTLTHSDGREETFRLPDRHGSFSVTSEAAWSVGMPDGWADYEVTFDSGGTTRGRIRAGETLEVAP